MNTFAEFGLLATLQETLLEKGILRPTEIQVRALPALLSGRSIVGIAETGSGKTLELGVRQHFLSFSCSKESVSYIHIVFMDYLTAMLYHGVSHE
jgi:hypothetical protein